MWTCKKCGRIFAKAKQPHSCQKVSPASHFGNKEKAEGLFKHLVDEVENKIGKIKIISLPCCIHLFGKFDFMAVLPKKDGLEVRFALNRKLDSYRLKQSVPVSKSAVKNCIDVVSKEEIDEELIGWLREAYHFKD